MAIEKAHAGARRRPPRSAACAFCGRAWKAGVVSRSDEHVWGVLHNDARELPAERMSHVAGFGTTLSGQSFIELPTVTTTNKASVLHVITREVCQDCNNGWMSRLEQTAKPLILSLVDAARDGTLLELNTEQRRILATWAQKTAITNELADQVPEMVTTAAMGRRLHDGLPLRGSMVWAARNDRDYWPETALVIASIGAGPHPLPGEKERLGLLVMIVYRYLTLVVFIGGDHGDLPPVVPPPLLLDRWTRIWPVTGPMEYPPSVALGSAELTRTMVDQRAWYPLSPIGVFHRSPFAPQVINRN